MNSENLAAAVRWLDKHAKDEQAINSGIGIDMDSIQYVADQRALRVILLIFRGEKVPQKTTDVKLNTMEQMLCRLLAACSMDGISIGLAASKGLSDDLPSPSQEN